MPSHAVVLPPPALHLSARTIGMIILPTLRPTWTPSAANMVMSATTVTVAMDYRPVTKLRMDSAVLTFISVLGLLILVKMKPDALKRNAVSTLRRVNLLTMTPHNALLRIPTWFPLRTKPVNATSNAVLGTVASTRIKFSFKIENCKYVKCELYSLFHYFFWCILFLYVIDVCVLLSISTSRFNYYKYIII